MFRATVLTSRKKKGDAPGILYCSILSTSTGDSPVDDGEIPGVVPVIYTSPYAHHSEGGSISFPPDTADILVEKVGKFYYYIATVVGFDPDLIDEVSDDTNLEKLSTYSVDKSYAPIYDRDGFPNSLIWKHPRGHYLMMKDEVPLITEQLGTTPSDPGRSVFNSKIEMKSAKGKMVSLDDSAAVDSMRVGILNGKDKNILDGITIGHGINDSIGSRCITIKTENNISNISQSGNIKHKVEEGNNIEIENKSTGVNGNVLSPTGPNFGNISLGTMFNDINLVAGTNTAVASTPAGVQGADIVKGILGASKIIIEALGLSRAAGAAAPVVRISSDGSIEIISNDLDPTTGTINIKSVGDINIESTAGRVNIKGLLINLNDPAYIPFQPLPSNPPPILPTPLNLRGYIPFHWAV